MSGGPFRSMAEVQAYLKRLRPQARERVARELGVAEVIPAAPRPAARPTPAPPQALAAAEAVVIVLPYPPSLNRIWRSAIVQTSAGPRIKVLLSRAGRAYRKQVVTQVAQVGRPPLAQRLAVHMHVCPPDQRARDLSNIPKALEDALTHAGFWADDSLIDELRVVRGPVCQGGSVTVTMQAFVPTDYLHLQENI